MFQGRQGKCYLEEQSFSIFKMITASDQDGEIGTRLCLLWFHLKQLKAGKNIWNNFFQYFGYQATENSEHQKIGHGWGESSNCPSLPDEQSFQAVT